LRYDIAGAHLRSISAVAASSTSATIRIMLLPRDNVFGGGKSLNFKLALAVTICAGLEGEAIWTSVCQ
jgi:hypothetical protein